MKLKLELYFYLFLIRLHYHLRVVCVHLDYAIKIHNLDMVRRIQEKDKQIAAAKLLLAQYENIQSSAK